MVLVQRPATPLSDSQPLPSIAPTPVKPPASRATSLPQNSPPTSPKRATVSPHADTVSGTYEDLDSLFSPPPSPAVSQPTKTVPFVLSAPKTAKTEGVAPAMAQAASEDRGALPTNDKRPENEAPASADSASVESLEASGVHHAPSTFAMQMDRFFAWAAIGHRQIWLVAGAAVVGILMAVTFVGLLLSWTTATPSEVAESPPSAVETKTEPPPPNTADNPKLSPTDSTTAPPTKTEVTPDVTPSPAPASKPSPVTPPPADATEAPKKSEPLPQPEPEDKPGIDLKPKEPAGPLVAKLPDNNPLNMFSELMSNSPPPPAKAPAEPKPASEPNAAPPPSSAETPAAQPALPRPAPLQIDVPSKLATKILGIEFKNQPLSSFTQFISDFSTIPISLDTDALLAKRLSVNAPISISLSETTVQQALSEALKPHQLAALPGDGHLLVSFPNVEEANFRQVAHKVSDLTGGKQIELQELSRWITEFVAFGNWPENSDTIFCRVSNDAIAIRHRDQVHFQTALFLDKLRAARGLPSKNNSEEIKPDSLAKRAASALATPITLNFSRADRFTKILARLGKAANCQFVVDWQALAEVGWNPAANVSLIVENSTLAETLNQFLTPMELGYRVVDSQTIQISSLATLGTKLEIESYSVAKHLNSDTGPQDLIARIQETVGVQHFRSFGGDGVIRYDAPSQCVFALLPQARQRDVTRILQPPAKPTPSNPKTTE